MRIDNQSWAIDQMNMWGEPSKNVDGKKETPFQSFQFFHGMPNIPKFASASWTVQSQRYPTLL